MAQVFKKRYRTFIDCNGEQTDPTHDYDVSTTYHHADDGAEYDTVDEVVTDIIDNAKYDIPALPKTGTWVEQGELYTNDGQVYKVRQSHRVTIYDPAIIPALFTVYRKEATGDIPNEWIDGEKVDVGTLRMYKDVKYECIQSHQTQKDWTPDKVASLWRLYNPEPVGQEWAAGVAYKVGDIVTYKSSTYTCRQAHTSISTWYPSVVPALWQLQ